MSPNDVASAFQTATRLHQGGRLRDAENVYRGILGSQPDHAFCLQQYGLLLAQLERQREALPHLEKSCRLMPRQPAFWNNLGELYRQLDRLVDSYHAFHSALALTQRMPEVYYNLGNTLKQLGRHDDAIAAFQASLTLKPDYDRALYNLGNALREEGRLVSAVEAYRKAIAARPDWSDPHLNMANAFYDMHKFEEAAAEYRRAAALKPDDVDIADSLGNVLVAQGDVEGAAQVYRQAQARRPEKWLRELRADLLTPPVASDKAAIDEYRARLPGILERYFDRGPIRLDDLHSSGAEPPMALAYQGRDDRAISEAFAEFFAARLPAAERPAPGTGKPKVGVVVTHGHEGVFARCLGELIARLDPAKLDVQIVCSRSGANVLRHMLPATSLSTFALPAAIEPAVAMLREARFDLLHYWEIGTDSTNYVLPFFRLAPVQSACWGWPVTSGNACVDYYVSVDALEPANGEAHYTEQLVRLKRLPTYYSRPPVPARPTRRESLGLPAAGRVYLCQQNVRKYHPDFDAVLGDILRADPDGVVAAIADEQPRITEMLQARLRRSIPDVAGRVVALPRLEREEYLGLVAAADVILDTPYYGGGANTVLDAVAAGTPVVTWAGPNHRGRWATAVNRALGLNGLVADRLADYAGMAVSLAREPDRLLATRRTILERADGFFADDGAVQELEAFFLDSITKSRS